MKLITEIDDDKLFMKKIYEIVEVVDSCLEETGIMEIRKRFPELTGNESDEEIQELKRIQIRKNLLDMAKALLVEKPDAAIKLFRSLCVVGDGEEYPHGLDLIGIAFKCIADKRVLDFFIQLTQLGQMISNA